MIVTKKYRYRPVYKKFINLKNNVQNRQKLLKFKKKKWKNLLFTLTKTSKFRKRNCYYKFFDQNNYTVSKYNNFFSNNYKQKVLVKKMFNLFYSNLNKKYLKTLYKTSRKKSNQIKNKINLKKIFISLLESRLDIILVRSHFVLSIRNARQLVSHKHVLVNGVVISDHSFLLNKGDLVTFSKKSHKIIRYFIILSDIWPLPPTHLQIDYKLFQIHIVEHVILVESLSQNLLWLNLNESINSYSK